MSKRSGRQRFERHWAKARHRLPWALTPLDIKWARTAMVGVRTVLNELIDLTTLSNAPSANVMRRTG